MSRGSFRRGSFVEYRRNCTDEKPRHYAAEDRSFAPDSNNAAEPSRENPLREWPWRLRCLQPRKFLVQVTHQPGSREFSRGLQLSFSPVAEPPPARAGEPSSRADAEFL